MSRRAEEIYGRGRCDGENILLHRRFKRDSTGISPIFTLSSSRRLTDTQTETREEKEQNEKEKEQRELIFLWNTYIMKSDVSQNKNRYRMSSFASLFVIIILSLLPFFCGLILVNFLHFKSLDHSNGCWLCSLLLDIKWSHLLVVLKISFKQDDGLHLSHAEYIQTCSSEIKQLRRDWMKYLH